MPGLSITQLRTDLRLHLFGEDDEQELSKAEADELLNRSYWEICDKFPFREKEATVSFSTVAETNEYSVLTSIGSGFEGIRKVSLTDLAGLVRSLDRMTLDRYRSVYEYGSTSIPTSYIRDGSLLRLWPTPDNIYAVTIDYLKSLADLGDANNPEIPQVWHEIIFLGAAWRFHLQNKNYSSLNEVRQVQYGLINTTIPVESKEERDSHNAAIRVVRNSWRR